MKEVYTAFVLLVSYALFFGAVAWSYIHAVAHALATALGIHCPM
jgi:hypothetical protein